MVKFFRKYWCLGWNSLWDTLFVVKFFERFHCLSWISSRDTDVWDGFIHEIHYLLWILREIFRDGIIREKQQLSELDFFERYIMCGEILLITIIHYLDISIDGIIQETPEFGMDSFEIYRYSRWSYFRDTIDTDKWNGIGSI